MTVIGFELTQHDLFHFKVQDCMPIDPHQLAELLTKYWPVLVAWVGGDRHAAEDTVQQAFIQLAQEDPVPVNCVAWLFQVSKRFSINQNKSGRKRQLREKTVAESRLLNQQTRATAEFDLQDSLAQLDDSQREIIVARIWGGLTFDEIGGLLQLSTSTVWRSYHDGIDRLKHVLGEH